MRIVIVFFTIILFASNVFAGWGPTNWGMSKKEVIKATNLTLDTSFRTRHRTYPTYTSQIKIGGHEYRINFGIHAEGLDEVLIRSNRSRKNHSYHYEAFLDLKESLTKKYGSPIDSEKNERGSSSSEEVKWLTEDSFISLFYVVLGSPTSSTYTGIQYKPRSSSSLNKFMKK